MYLSKFDNKLNVNIFFITLLKKNSIDENNMPSALDWLIIVLVFPIGYYSLQDVVFIFAFDSAFGALDFVIIVYIGVFF